MKHLTLGFGPGHDLTVCESEPCVGLYADSMEPAWDSFPLSLSLSFPLFVPHSRLLSLSQNKHLKVYIILHYTLHFTMYNADFIKI